MQPDTFYSWGIKGIGGGVNILERLQQDNAVPSDGAYEELSILIDRLVEVQKKMADQLAH